MSKNLNINRYLDFYESLLTDKQREIMGMYYHDDFSLSEIAEELCISRSAVSDLIKRVTHTLEEYENKLQLINKFEKRCALYGTIEAHSDIVVQKVIKQLKEIE